MHLSSRLATAEAARAAARTAARLAGLVAGLMASLVSGACSPALDWRESRSAESGVAALFPCRPVVQSRTVRLVDKVVLLTLRACHAEGVTWAVSTADVEDPALVRTALDALVESAQTNLGGRSQSRVPFIVVGGTPNPGAVRELIAGQLPDGKAVIEHVAVFARATWVVQVTALGSNPASDAVTTFFESIRVVS